MKFISEESEKPSPADAAKEQESTFEEMLENVVALIIMAGLLGGILVFGYQIKQWLKTGVWIEFPFILMFTWLKIDLSVIANMEWQGIKKILVWFLELPLSLMLIALGVALASLLIAVTSSLRRA